MSSTSLCCLLGIPLGQSNRGNLGFLVTVYICYAKTKQTKKCNWVFLVECACTRQTFLAVLHIKMLTVFKFKSLWKVATVEEVYKGMFVTRVTICTCIWY